MTEMLTPQDAARRLGRSPGSILSAIARGVLPADCRRGPGRRMQANRYLIKPSDLERFAREHPHTPKPPRWSEADEQAVVELYRSGGCTVRQIAEYVGRPYAAVNVKLSKLAEKGVLEGRGLGDLNPFHCPRSGILLAKTCPTCGLLREAQFFNMARGYPSTQCSVCYNTVDKKKGRGDLHQQMTLAQAGKRCQRYTDADIEVILDKSKSTLQVALELGRTYNSIGTMRHKLEFNPTIRRRKVPSHWVIEFPNAQRVLEEYFAALGRPVPESEWDWNEDEEVCAV